MRKAKAYKKLIVAVAGMIAMIGHRQLGLDPSVIEPALVDVIIGSLTAAGVFGFRNEEQV